MATPAQPKQWYCVGYWWGNGIKHTRKFTVAPEWAITWDLSAGSGSAPSDLTIYVKGADGQSHIAAMTEGPSRDTTYMHEGGTFWLSVLSTGAWVVEVDELR